MYLKREIVSLDTSNSLLSLVVRVNLLILYDRNSLAMNRNSFAITFSGRSLVTLKLVTLIHKHEN
jgi:hypothetical protein